MISSSDREIQALVHDIRDGKLLLPEMQRGYVWKAIQVRDLFDSLYRGYPSGQLLVWETTDLPHSRRTSVQGIEEADRRPQLLLDGQQRLTSLTAVMLGQPLLVRDSSKPIDIAFNVFTERFEVANIRQRGEAGWVSISKVFTSNVIAAWMDLKLDPASDDAKMALERLTRLEAIRKYRYRVNLLEGLSYSEVTNIFVRINSGGTTLGSADLALAQVSSRWRGVTQEFDNYLKGVKALGLGSLDYGMLLRTIAVLLTNRSLLSQFFRGERQHQFTVEDLQSAWQRARVALEKSLQFLIHNCKIDQLSLMPTTYILVPLAVYFDRFRESSAQELRELQRWVYLALIWSRYSNATETAVDQDVAALAKDDPIGKLVQNIVDKVGRLHVTERELRDQLKNSPYMLMLYVLARSARAEDWYTGVVLGGNQAFEPVNIFPKPVLRKIYEDLRAQTRTVDQIANLVLISPDSASRIGRREPALYFPEIDVQRLRAQYVPIDPSLLTVEAFEEFLLQRRMMLANAINDLLHSLTNRSEVVLPGDQMLRQRVDAIEHQMRDIVGDRLEEAYGDQAWHRAVPTSIRSRVERIETKNARNHPYATEEDNSIHDSLGRCLFSDYPTIITSQANWPLFEDIFGDASKLEHEYASITDARNRLAHNGQITPVVRAAAEAGLLWVEACLRRFNASVPQEEFDGGRELDLGEKTASVEATS